MFKTIMAIFSFLTGLWKSVPKESQDQILTTIAEGFDDALRAFFRMFKQQEQQAADVKNGQQTKGSTQDVQFS